MRALKIIQNKLSVHSSIKVYLLSKAKFKDLSTFCRNVHLSAQVLPLLYVYIALCDKWNIGQRESLNHRKENC